MKRFFYSSVSRNTDNSSRDMEPETISKNGASPKSLTSRRNLLFCMVFAMSISMTYAQVTSITGQTDVFGNRSSTVSSTLYTQQARINIENNSSRRMTVKVMKGSSHSASLHETVSIAPNSKSTIYFSHTGYYFCKTKAVLGNREPVYRQGDPFYVVNDNTGYSVITLTFSIVESSVPQITGGKQISEAEFNKN